MTINFAEAMLASNQAHQRACLAIRRDRTPIVMGKEQIEREEYKEYNPDTHDFRWNADYSEVTIIPLAYWNDATYAAYQSDDPLE